MMPLSVDGALSVRNADWRAVQAKTTVASLWSRIVRRGRRPRRLSLWKHIGLDQALDDPKFRDQLQLSQTGRRAAGSVPLKRPLVNLRKDHGGVGCCGLGILHAVGIDPDQLSAIPL